MQIRFFFILDEPTLRKLRVSKQAVLLYMHSRNNKVIISGQRMG